MKASELNQRTDNELKAQQEQLREEIFRLRMKRSANQLDDTSRIRQIRRDLARVLTIQTSRRQNKV